MFRNLAFVGLCLTAVTGCRETTTQNPVDLSHAPGDMAVNPNADMSMMQAMTSTTPHDIDTGSVAPDTMVKMTALSIVSNVHRHFSKNTMYCEYRVMVQDPSCTMPPCGIELYTRGVKLTAPDAGTLDCPYADQSTTPFKDIGHYGDVVDVTGSVKSFPDSMGSVVLHSITVDSLTVTMSKGPVPSPISVTDTSPSQFVPDTGMGWNTYEGTYIKLSPSSGKFTVNNDVNTFGEYTVSPGGAHFSGSNYGGPKDAGTFPSPGAMYSSIAGVVVLDFGGSIEPLYPNDYQP